jgi:hypothetical protein
MTIKISTSPSTCWIRGNSSFVEMLLSTSKIYSGGKHSLKGVYSKLGPQNSRNILWLAHTKKHRETMGFYFDQMLMANLLGYVGTPQRWTHQSLVTSTAPWARSAWYPTRTRIWWHLLADQKRSMMVPLTQRSTLHWDHPLQRSVVGISNVRTTMLLPPT